MSMIVRNANWPFRIVDSFFDDLWEPDFTLLRFPMVQFPSLDIKEADNEYTITVDAPGYTKEEINIEVKDDILTISSEHKDEKEENKEGYIYKERSERSFSRSIRIPKNVNAEEVNATLDNGLLTLTIPKKEPVEPRKIKIQNLEALPEGEVKEPEPEKIEETEGTQENTE